MYLHIQYYTGTSFSKSKEWNKTILCVNICGQKLNSTENSEVPAHTLPFPGDVKSGYAPFSRAHLVDL